MSKRVISTALFMLLAVPSLAPLHGEIVDRVVAVVGDRVITRSDLVAEARYQAFLNGQAAPSSERLANKETLQPFLSRLIDQSLLEQARTAFPFSPQQDGQTERRLEEIRKRFPSPSALQKALGDFELTEGDLRMRLSQEEAIMAFIESRLRPQIQITPAAVEEYYNSTLTLQLRAEGQSSAPPLTEVRSMIEQVLVQKELGRRLEEWLKELHARTEVRVLL